MTSAPATGAAALVAHLEDLAKREERGALAALRRGLGKEPGTAPEMYPHVEPYLGRANRPRADAAYLVATLFGLHSVPWARPANVGNTSFGWSLGHIRFRDGGAEDEGVSRRFAAALNCDREALAVHLRQLLSLLHSRAGEAPVDWQRLYWDFVDWDEVDRRVQRRWAEAFWRGGAGAAAHEGQGEPPDAQPSS